MRLEELKVFQLSMEIGNDIWRFAKDWDYFTRKTIGIQVIRSADSIAANISEGYGRYYYKESKVFYYYARGSSHETRTWLLKAKERKLITPEQHAEIDQKCNILIAGLNQFIKSVGKNYSFDSKNPHDPLTP
jgi:four helix bundle protein